MTGDEWGVTMSNSPDPSALRFRWYNAVGVAIFAVSFVGMIAVGGVAVLTFAGVIGIDPELIPVWGLSMSALWTLGVLLGGAD